MISQVNNRKEGYKNGRTIVRSLILLSEAKSCVNSTIKSKTTSSKNFFFFPFFSLFGRARNAGTRLFSQETCIGVNLFVAGGGLTERGDKTGNEGLQVWPRMRRGEEWINDIGNDTVCRKMEKRGYQAFTYLPFNRWPRRCGDFKCPQFPSGNTPVQTVHTLASFTPQEFDCGIHDPVPLRRSNFRLSTVR